MRILAIPGPAQGVKAQLWPWPWPWPWPWRRAAAAAPIQPLAWQLPNAAGMALKNNNKELP